MVAPYPEAAADVAELVGGGQPADVPVVGRVAVKV